MRATDKRFLRRVISREGRYACDGAFASYRSPWTIRAAHRLTRAGLVVCAISKYDFMGDRPFKELFVQVPAKVADLKFYNSPIITKRNAGNFRWK